MYWGHLLIRYRAIRKANVTIPSSSGGGLEIDWQFRADRQAYHTWYAWEPVRRAYSRPWYISCNCSAIPPLFAKSWLKINSLCFQSSIIDLQRGFDRTPRTPPPPPTRLGGFSGGPPFFLVFSKRFCTTPALLTVFQGLLQLYLTIGSCFSVHYRVMEHAGSLESTKEA